MLTKDLKRLGVKLPAAKVGDVRLRTLPGVAGTDTRNEHEFQSAAVRHYRGVIKAPCCIAAVPNQRFLGHLTAQHRHSILRQLSDDGVIFGALDTIWEWHPANGRAGNAGSAWMEFKRACNPEPLKRTQIDFIVMQRAMGRVAGFVQCVEHIEELLEEAGAPLLARSFPRAGVPPWWAPLGGLPPLAAAPAPQITGWRR